MNPFLLLIGLLALFTEGLFVIGHNDQPEIYKTTPLKFAVTSLMKAMGIYDWVVSKWQWPMPFLFLLSGAIAGAMLIPPHHQALECYVANGLMGLLYSFCMLIAYLPVPDLPEDMDTSKPEVRLLDSHEEHKDLLVEEFEQLERDMAEAIPKSKSIEPDDIMSGVF